MNARTYHDRTKHSVASVQANRHRLDWDNQPLPFKIYRDLAPMPLPEFTARAPVPALDAIAAVEPCAPRRSVPAHGDLAHLLHRTAGITRTRRYPGGQVMHFRAAACTGALYHIDVYVVCADLPGLTAGVYHFGPHDGALRRVRAGDHRGVLERAGGDTPLLAGAPVSLVFSSTWWRNAWKYQSRAYRHVFWDTGTMLANLLAVAAADGFAARVVVGFVDRIVNALLGLDAEREGAVAIVALGDAAAPRPHTDPPVPPLALATEPLSAHEVDYPLIRAMHAASSLENADAVRAWHAVGARPNDPVARPVPTATIAQRPAAAAAGRTIDDVILHRGSTRRFAPAPIGFEALTAMLHAATRGVPGDWHPSPEQAMATAYLIVNGVDGLDAGTYVYTPETDALAPLRRGTFRREAGFLDLGQELAADAAVNVYLLSHIDRIVARLGDRGYRAAQLESAIIAGKLYLAAYALGLGATGLTFFDDDVVAFFSPHAAGQDVMFLLAAGVPARSSPGRRAG
jgi:SagB-type dehydrogenase family enzyme